MKKEPRNYPRLFFIELTRTGNFSISVLDVWFCTLPEGYRAFFSAASRFCVPPRPV